jgi:hypothetical protein
VTEVAHSYKEIEKSNMDMVGENTILEERIHSKFPASLFCFSGVCFPFPDFLF